MLKIKINYMKKILFVSRFLFIVLLICTIKASGTLQGDNLSDIHMTNIEALASGESGGQPMNCYSHIEKKDDGSPVETVTYCGDCQPIRCTRWWNQSRCMR